MSDHYIVNAKGIVIGSSVLLNDTSIALQIDASNKALLLSRVTDTASVVMPENGMLVYSKKDNMFYFRQADKWITFGTFNGGVTTLNGQLGDIVIGGDANRSVFVTNTSGNRWEVKANY
ncbi:MAG TPA: hypothetical protein VF408_05760, partial [Sediminibacterium sp.]